jgi:hypothetical protein
MAIDDLLKFTDGMRSIVRMKYTSQAMQHTYQQIESSRRWVYLDNGIVKNPQGKKSIEYTKEDIYKYFDHFSRRRTSYEGIVLAVMMNDTYEVFEIDEVSRMYTAFGYGWKGAQIKMNKLEGTGSFSNMQGGLVMVKKLENVASFNGMAGGTAVVETLEGKNNFKNIEGGKAVIFRQKGEDNFKNMHEGLVIINSLENDSFFNMDGGTVIINRVTYEGGCYKNSGGVIRIYYNEGQYHYHGENKSSIYLLSGDLYPTLEQSWTRPDDIELEEWNEMQTMEKIRLLWDVWEPRDTEESLADIAINKLSAGYYDTNVLDLFAPIYRIDGKAKRSFNFPIGHLSRYVGCMSPNIIRSELQNRDVSLVIL